ncbi:MAG: S8 family serine peptidase [Fibrella sp.]|nr:S8 family serine peptidase [Armatimonadota bacterium]
MKPHLIVKMAPSVPLPAVAHWQEIIADKSLAQETLSPSVDHLLRQRKIPVWVAREYRSAGAQWTPEEYAHGLQRVFRLILQEDKRIPDDLADAITLLPGVEYARPGMIAVSPLPTPTAQAMGVSTDRESREAIFLPEAHRWSRGDGRITVAVLDSGVCLTHLELTSTLVPGYDFVDILSDAGEFFGDAIGADADPTDEVGHGTHVAGIIAAKGKNMPVGVAPLCRIMPVRVLGALRQGERRVGAGLIDNINTALKWAVDNGADVINMSFGIKHEGGGLPHREVVEYALSRGVTLVAATGNDGQDALYYPGALPGVIAVGAAESGGEKASFSTYGPQVTLVAPGTEVFSAYREDGYAYASGTSQAAPFVSGAAALLKSYAMERGGRHLSDRQVKHLLKHTADRHDSRFRTPQTGYGQINVADALRLLDYRLK